MQSAMIPLNALPGDDRGAGMVMVPMPEYPPDYVVWSVASLVYGNPCCLGLLAFRYSIKSRDRKMMGDMAGAEWYGSRACCVNVCAVNLIILLVINLILVYILLIAKFNDL